MNTLTTPDNTGTIEIKNTVTGEVQRVACLFGGVQGKRLQLETNERIPVSTTLSVEYNDALFLGEVVVCTQHAGSRWQLEINIEQILTGLQSLVTLRSRLLGETGVPTFSMRPSAMYANH